MILMTTLLLFFFSFLFAGSGATPHLFDSRHQVVIGPPRNLPETELVTMGATSILHDQAGNFVGVYIDNETPNRNFVAKAIDNKLGGNKMVVVGLYPSEPCLRIPGCICAYEWYPFHKGWGMPPNGPQAWILQWNFAWPGDKPPTGLQKYRLLGWVKLRHPKAKLIWLY